MAVVLSVSGLDLRNLARSKAVGRRRCCCSSRTSVAEGSQRQNFFSDELTRLLQVGVVMIFL